MVGLDARALPPAFARAGAPGTGRAAPQQIGAEHCERQGDHFEPAHEHERRRGKRDNRSEEHTSELQSHSDLVCRLLLEKKKKKEISNRSQERTTRLQRSEEQ